MKISTARLKQIIKEELFYREFHRGTEKLTEVESEKQRRYMCAMKGRSADERPSGLSQSEAEEMCSGPMKETNPDQRTVAGTQNLDHLDPDAGDPEEEFFGDKVDPDEVGLQTGEWTPEQFRKFMKRKKR